jgi:hypothetical protein
LYPRSSLQGISGARRSCRGGRAKPGRSNGSTSGRPNPAAPAAGPLSIPPAQPPIFLSPPDPAGAAPAQPAGVLGSIGPSINNGLAGGINNHALTLMALGAGIAQGVVGKGLAAAAAAAQAERNLQAQQINFSQTYNALTGAGVPADEALAAVLNPSLMRTLAMKYLGPKAPGNASSAPAAASAANNPASDFQANALSMMPASSSAPALAPNVPSSARYSPSRNLWRDPDGNRFDRQGKAFP